MISVHLRPVFFWKQHTCQLVCCRVLFVVFKGNDSYKYGCGLLETLIQLTVFLSDIQSRLMWIRFWNSYNLVNTNISLDLRYLNSFRLIMAIQHELLHVGLLVQVVVSASSTMGVYALNLSAAIVLLQKLSWHSMLFHSLLGSTLSSYVFVLLIFKNIIANVLKLDCWI